MIIITINSSGKVSTTVSRFDYTNDEIGRRTAIARSGAAFSSLSGAVDAYGYNGRSEVTSARRTLGGDEVRGFAFDYAYDPIGNRTSSAEYDENGIRRLSLYESNALNEYTRRTVAGHATVLGEADADAAVTVNGATAWRKGPYFYGGANVFNATNAVFAELGVEAVRDLGGGTNEVDSAVVRRFVPETPERFTYDADGNMTSDGRWTYTWNGENRLIQTVETVHPTNRAPRVVEYAYDHRSRMVWKTIGGTNAPPDTALAYLWDDYNIVRETLVTRTSSLVTDNIWGLDLDGTMQGCGGVGGLLAVVKNGEVYTPTYDANGNISEYLDSDGTIIAHQEYDPFGNAVVSAGDTSTFTHWFSTKPWCGVTGMVEYQYRNYKPGIGRWMSRDPLEEHGARDYALVGHCHNNPIDLFEVLGKQFEWIGPLQDFRYQMIGDSFVPPPPAPAVEESQEESSELWQYVAALARGFAEGFSDAIHSAEYLKCEAACSLDALIGSAIPFEISIGNAFYRYDDNWNWQDAVSLNVPSLSIGAFEMFERLQYNDMGGDFLENRLKDLLTRENSKIGMRHRRQLEAKLAKLNTAHRNILLAKQASVILAIANALKDYWDCYEKHCKKCLEADNNN